MKITHIKTTLVDVPFDKPISTAIHQMRSVGCVLVELGTDEGIIGESLVFTLNGARLRALQETVLGFSHQVEGKDPNRVTEITQSIWSEMNPIGHASFPIAALSAIDTACWDIIGKAVNKPLHHLFGAYRDRVETYASGGLWLSQSIEECVKEAGAFIESGFTAMKIRVGSRKIEDDITRVREIRRAVGQDITLLADANQGLTVKHAVKLANKLEEFDIAWLEEPVSYQNLTGHAEIRRSTTIPIASGETQYTHLGMHEILKAGAVDVLMPDLQRIGGFSEFRRAAALAKAYHIPFSSHLFTEYSLCIAGAEHGCISVEHMPWFSPLFNESLELDAGMLIIADRPGIGFTFNHTVVKKYALH